MNGGFGLSNGLLSMSSGVKGSSKMPQMVFDHLDMRTVCVDEGMMMFACSSLAGKDKSDVFILVLL